MSEFMSTYKTEILYSVILLIILLIIRGFIVITVKQIGKKSGTTEARANLIGRYVTVTLLIIGLLIEGYILGVETGDILVVFSTWSLF